MSDGVLRQILEEGQIGTLRYAPLQVPVQVDQGQLQAVRDLLYERLPPALLDPVAPARERNSAISRVLRGLTAEQVRQIGGLPTDEAQLMQLVHEAIGWGPAQVYLDDERVQEIKIIGDRLMIQEEGADFVLVPERFRHAAQALDRALLLAARLNVRLDRSRPQDTLPLAHGTRMHVSIPPCTPDEQALICIRRGRPHAWTLADILHRGSIDQTVHDLLLLLVRAGCSFLIAGETGSGKTALLEALVNSWPGEPHVITIEDNTLEIHVRHAAWTRELVQTSSEPDAFGRAAREVLRQTPTVVVPGETRGAEAGAIVAVAVSGHAVMTTIHARSAERAIGRLADCAAMPGAYLYAGRRANALEDICDNFHVLLHVTRRAGRRYLDDLVLIDGWQETAQGLRPRVLRLAWAVLSGAQISWQVAARPGRQGFIWPIDDQTPDSLRERFARMTDSSGQPARSWRAQVDQTLRDAALALQADAPQQALQLLRRMWQRHADPRLIAPARHALTADGTGYARAAGAAAAVYAEIRQAMQQGRWEHAAICAADLAADLDRYAAFTPPHGWPVVIGEIEAGRRLAAQAAQLIEQAARAAAGGDLRTAADLLATLPPVTPAPEQQAHIRQLRRQLHEVAPAQECVA